MFDVTPFYTPQQMARQTREYERGFSTGNIAVAPHFTDPKVYDILEVTPFFTLPLLPLSIGEIGIDQVRKFLNCFWLEFFF